MIEVKSVLIIGHGGCRMDFVAGWLGKLDGFIDTGWHINPVTGESYGERTTKMIDSNGACIQDELLKFGYKLTDNANKMIASGCHGYKLNSQLTGCNTNNLIIIRINVTQDFIDKIVWDFIVKTWLETTQSKWSVHSKIREMVDFITRIGLIIEVDYPTIDVDYAKLLSMDGAYYIADKLGLEPTGKHYKLWDDALSIASSPEEIELHGQLWRKQDFF